MSSYIPPSRATPTEIISTSLFSECSLMKLCIGKEGVYPQTGKIRTIFWKLSKSMSNGEMRGSFSSSCPLSRYKRYRVPRS